MAKYDYIITVMASGSVEADNYKEATKAVIAIADDYTEDMDAKYEVDLVLPNREKA